MVESLFSWAAMQCQTIGIAPREFLRFLSPTRTSQSYLPSLLIGPGVASRRNVEAISQHCNAEHLKCGTFFVLTDLVDTSFRGMRSTRHKWCPVCLARPASELYLPLLFALSAISRCPEHGCDLVEKCPHCDAPQELSWLPSKWVRCSRCDGSLVHAIGYSRRHRYLEWANSQCAQLVELCADPDTAPVNRDAVHVFVREFLASKHAMEMDGYLRIYLYDGHVASRRMPTLDNMLIFCAMQGVGLSDILLRPTDAASPVLFPEWRSIRSIRFLLKNPKAFSALTSIVSDVKWFQSLGYVPSPAALMSIFGLPACCFHDLTDSAYALYADEARGNSWQDSNRADTALKITIAKLKGAIEEANTLHFSSILSSHWRFRSLHGKAMLPILSLAAVRIVAHLHSSGSAFSNVEGIFRSYAIVFVGDDYQDYIGCAM